MSELRVDNIVSQDGTSAPVYTQGIVVGAGKTLTAQGGDIKLGDSDHLYFGDNNGLDIYHASDYTLIQHMPQGIFAIENSNTGAGSDLYLTAGEDITLRPNGGNNGIQIIKQGAVRLYWNNGQKLATTTDGITVTGTVTDSMGPLRRLGINAHNAATYTLVAGDAGKLVREAASSANITIPQNVFSAGDMISIFNVSGGVNTITQGTGTTLYNTADGATGNRTLSAKGVCTIVCTSTNEFIISGSGLS